jgi:hypothetical protein
MDRALGRLRAGALLVTTALIIGGSPPAHVLASLETWHGPLHVVTGRSLAGVDLVVASGDGTEATNLVARARRAGVRVVEVVDAR